MRVSRPRGHSSRGSTRVEDTELLRSYKMFQDILANYYSLKLLYCIEHTCVYIVSYRLFRQRTFTVNKCG